MTPEAKAKFVATCGEVVNSNCSDESLIGIINAVLNLPVEEWPDGAGLIVTTATTTIADCVMLDSGCGAVESKNG